MFWRGASKAAAEPHRGSISTLTSIALDNWQKCKDEFGLDYINVMDQPHEGYLAIVVSSDEFYTWAKVSHEALKFGDARHAIKIMDDEFQSLCKTHQTQVADMIFKEAEEGWEF